MQIPAVQACIHAVINLSFTSWQNLIVGLLILLTVYGSWQPPNAPSMGFQIYYKFTSCTFFPSCLNRRVVRPYICLNMALILLGPMLLKFVAHVVNAQPSLLSASLPDWDRCSSCSSWEVCRVSPTVYSSPWT